MDGKTAATEPDLGRAPAGGPEPGSHVHRTPRGWWARWSAPLALAWSAVTAVWAVTWAVGLLPSPFTDPASASYGAVFNTADPLVGSAFTAVLGLLGVGCGLAALRVRGGPGGLAVQVGAWLLAATVLLALFHGGLLPVLGYTPVTLVLMWFEPGLGTAYLTEIAEPETVFLVHCLAGGLLWMMAAIGLGRVRRGACADCGRTSGWTPEREAATRAKALRIGRIAVAVAVACALLYPAVRFPWLFGMAVGMPEASFADVQSSGQIVAVGVGLGTVALGGAVLMIGLVSNWGVRFPRWMLGLAGRRVPVSLAVVPASVAAIAFAALGRGLILAVVGADFPLEVGGSNLIALGAMFPSGLALAAATAAYAVRRRAECASCGRGEPEALPR
ncbi:hypothetical protein [Allonocardiopsis opalescens]|uniref:Uncharacterized protein n=1 Tax=Allonocardiopsis opalescens TaxID=1144618 RepID=A0A2T0QAS9_9ACTN|nr:hypothetical protein [Allonocardiopsis opalescens]PRY00947.1 hypothetical protein CLV72_102580 [Allonocardiopsis opalescens]